MIQLPNTATTGIDCGKAFRCAGKSFTVAAWIRRLGTGTTTSSGTGGLTLAEPIFTGGTGESETVGLNCAWFLAYVPASSSIGCDFEDRNNGLNHKVTASFGAVPNFSMSHICVTYNHTSSRDTASYMVYINGVFNNSSESRSTNELIRIPDTGSTQGIGIGCGITSTGTRGGAFLGQISDVAIWDTVLSAEEVKQLATSKIKGMPLQFYSSSLKGYWPLDETPDGATISTAVSQIKDRSGRNIHGTAFGTILSKADDTISYL